jgi:Ser/Thr protein kinase RdoA (MazF antagonist)
VLRTDLQPGIDAVLLEPANTRQAAAWHQAVESARRPGLSIACQTAAVESLVSRVAPRWARFLETIVHGDATPIDAKI